MGAALMDVSQEVTKEVEQWAADHPEPTLVAGQTVAYMALFDKDGNELARWDCGPMTVISGEVVFSDITLKVT